METAGLTPKLTQWNGQPKYCGVCGNRTRPVVSVTVPSPDICPVCNHDRDRTGPHSPGCVTPVYYMVTPVYVRERLLFGVSPSVYRSPASYLNGNFLLQARSAVASDVGEKTIRVLAYALTELLMNRWLRLHPSACLHR